MNEIMKGRREIKDDFDAPGRPGPSVQDLFRADTRPVPEPMLDGSNDFAVVEGASIAPERYSSREFHELEVERIWSRVWQVAAHEGQIQNVGDYIVYEIADTSLIVVRTAPDTIKAYYNACLHRGRMLCEKDGHAANFRCKFHGFMWKLDGSLGFVPSKWDFPDLKDEEFRLPEAKVATWMGFVFINLDPNAGPLEDYLGDMPQHFKAWRFESRHPVVHVAKIVRANWKICYEAFLEFFHQMATHPQALRGSSDSSTRYVARKGRHYGFMVSPTAVPSAYVADGMSDQQILEAATARSKDKTTVHQLPEGKTPREHFADLKRAEMTARTGRDYSAFSDTEIIDLLGYSLFPNTLLFGGFALPFWYRFRPWQNDPEMSLMEIFILSELPAGAPRPPAPKMTLLGPDQTFTDSPEFSGIGIADFYNQDLGNLEWLQKGLRTFPKESVYLARYQESEIRQFHSLIDAFIRDRAPAP